MELQAALMLAMWMCVSQQRQHITDSLRNLDKSSRRLTRRRSAIEKTTKEFMEGHQLSSQEETATSPFPTLEAFKTRRESHRCAINMMYPKCKCSMAITCDCLVRLVNLHRSWGALG
ncbi:unnamed protein product [Ostreobium quekettii]|uniref:Uncharacterized protein n=1 Tax=Ostreobium quekettii TaxID=121088 RepID=A0A8S1IL19_9CHLO|nr:unnamed protein product [Ostreobium quekettii]